MVARPNLTSSRVLHQHRGVAQRPARTPRCARCRSAGAGSGVHIRPKVRPGGGGCQPQRSPATVVRTCTNCEQMPQDHAHRHRAPTVTPRCACWSRHSMPRKPTTRHPLPAATSTAATSLPHRVVAGRGRTAQRFPPTGYSLRRRGAQSSDQRGRDGQRASQTAHFDRSNAGAGTARVYLLDDALARSAGGGPQGGPAVGARSVWPSETAT